jgi:transcriptional regulator with XRE-family HTH domain
MQDEPRTSRPGGRPLGALDPHSSLRARLGAEIRTRRTEKALSLKSLAELARSSSSHLSEVEHGRKLPSIGLIERLDEVLEADGELIALFPSAALEQTVQRHKQAGVGHGHDADQHELLKYIIGSASTPRDGGNGSRVHCTEQFARFFLSKWPGTQLSRPFPDYGADFNMLLPGRKALPSAFLNLQILSVEQARNNLLLTSAIRSDRLQQLLSLPSHALFIGAETANGITRFYGLGVSGARRQSAARFTQETRLLIPRAYALDDFTYGILWAVSTLDNSLLADDFALSESWRKLRNLQDQRQPSASPHVSELSGVGQLYMGSAFCAQHILSHYNELNKIPVFWTREQCGEEACTWLFFLHKYHYLLRTQGRFSDGGVTQLSRVFCIPEVAVVRSPIWERVLLFLSIALMESLQRLLHTFSSSQSTLLFQATYSHLSSVRSPQPGYERIAYGTWTSPKSVKTLESFSRT